MLTRRSLHGASLLRSVGANMGAGATASDEIAAASIAGYQSLGLLLRPGVTARWIIGAKSPAGETLGDIATLMWEGGADDGSRLIPWTPTGGAATIARANFSGGGGNVLADLLGFDVPADELLPAEIPVLISSQLAGPGPSAIRKVLGFGYSRLRGFATSDKIFEVRADWLYNDGGALGVRTEMLVAGAAGAFADFDALVRAPAFRIYVQHTGAGAASVRAIARVQR